MRPFSKHLRLIFFYRLPVIALCALIYWQSSSPGMISGSLFPHADKVLHFGAYAVLAVLFARSLKQEKPFWSPLTLKLIVIFFAALYGLSDEIHQAFVPSREMSGYDFLADCAGSLAGCLVYLHFFPVKSNTAFSSKEGEGFSS
ncbi:VanZ family protein [Desulfobacula sp.]|uniref:VanZ family protein n=1 Tax=Desulfobacula sp. TaxID=2593537 RepID=UPI00260A831A|nr:VanZ family protein [Desulfobacula sp.]